MTPNFFIVDVFAEQAYAGNPLAVVLGAELLSDETMQLIAAETNYSETTFVYSTAEANGGYRTRLFTPAREIAFAGHPILGTAWVVRNHLAARTKDSVKLNLQVGEIPVYFEGSGHGAGCLWFDAPPITTGIQCEPERMAAALGLGIDDIDSRYPIQVMSAGTAAVIVPLRSLAALQRALLDLKAYSALLAEGFPPLTYLFCAETRSAENDLSARFFFEAHGVREDPATGNGAAFLARYLRLHGVYPPEKQSWRIEQGHEVRRPSLVQIRVRNVPDATIQVGGGVVAAIQGNLVRN
jgi:trans-2,3-dihydro-3-hydroxyanthranilate isomerase